MAKRTRAMRLSGKSVHGHSVKNPATYEALRKQGMSKSQAAAISNGVLNKGYHVGRHQKSR